MPHQSDPARPRRPRRATAVSIGMVAALVTSACTGSGGTSTPAATSPAAKATMPAGPSCIKPQDGTGCLSLAPSAKRVDLIKPSFSNPTSVTNPLHPSSTVAQVLYAGQVDGKPLRTEFTLVPDIKTITWDGRQIKTITMQYLSFLDGRIEEVALDWFGQADDGAVWYFGEDVFNYEEGRVADTDGTWLAGKDGPPAMIMPAAPKVGDVYRSENIPGLVFEEVVVKSVGETVPGPSGQVGDSIVVTELHFDGKREDKVFAPGYGEFSTGDPGGDLEVVSLAVPTDARPGPLPAELTRLSAAVRTTYDKVGQNDWAGASAATAALQKAWEDFLSGSVPDVLRKQMSRDLDALGQAVASREPAAAHAAALRVAQNDLDLHARHQPVVKTDHARLALWMRQILIDAAATDPGAVTGDVNSFTWTWNRVRPTAEPAAAARIDTQLRGLQAAAAKKDLAGAAKAAPTLLAALASVRPG
jgi:hypothetical protein